jgi:hypothetical protein
MRHRMLGLVFVAAGLAAVAIGLWEGAHIVTDIVYQAQGKCDYLSCTGPWTLPSLTGNLVLVAAGSALLVMCAYRVTRGPSTAAQAGGGQTLSPPE